MNDTRPLTIRRHPELPGEFEITAARPREEDILPSGKGHSCLWEKLGGCKGPADYTARCDGHGHKLLGNWCEGHISVMLSFSRDPRDQEDDGLSCGECAADGHRCRILHTFDHELLADEEGPWTEAGPLYLWRFATEKDAAWWGQLDGRADHARFPRNIGDDEEITTFLGNLGEDPDLRGPALDVLIDAYRKAWDLGLEWLDRALPGTMGRECECGHDGRDHLAMYNELGPTHRDRCNSCGCQRFTPSSAAGSSARAGSGDRTGLKPGTAAASELSGDRPYLAALAALDEYVTVAKAHGEAAETLEAQLTLHGFDRDPALMGHISVLQQTAAQLEARAASARSGLVERHSAGDEYHSTGRDASESAFRNDAG